MKSKGLLLIYTGDGKGKTTAALGLAFRALGRGLRVAMVQFIKGKWKTGEANLARQLKGLTFLVMGAGFTWNDKDEAQHAQAAVAAWERAQACMASGEYDVVILDEVSYAVNYNFIPLEDVAHALAGRPAAVHAVLTGRNVPAALCALADVVTEMRALKHPFQRGYKAQPGVDY